MTDRVSLTRVINGPIDEVFDAWVDPEKLSIWHSPKGMKAKAREDEKSFVIEMNDLEDKQIGTVRGEYSEFDKPNRLVFSWHWDNDPTPPTTVEVNFKSLDKNKTEIHLEHFGFLDPKVAMEHSEGWESTLIKLEDFINERG